jgi:hypothetical protein
MIRALILDHQSILEVDLQDWSSQGAEFQTLDSGGTSPLFPKKTLVTLNLRDENSGQAEQSVVRIQGVSRRGGRWSYRLLWERVPDMLKIA